ncbi:hypothetical protein ABW19_dt0208651 [Dactylella cylindrospora]|nr:hypothetical protein ABW19_dt0208651 [Dactylella cylindrospora]
MQDPSSPPHITGLVEGLPTDGVVLVDIITSLSSPPFMQRKISAPPILTPYEVPQPRSGIPFDQGLIDRYEVRKDWLHKAFAVLHNDFKHCLPLATSSQLSGNNGDPSSQSESPADEEPDLSAYHQILRSVFNIALRPLVLEIILTEISLYEISLSDIYGLVHTNPLPFWVSTKIIIDKPIDWMIPPRSSFLLGSFNETTIAFQRYSRCATDKPGFNFILFDPPWPNRSAHRAKHQNSYRTSTFDPYDLFKLDLPNHVCYNGIVGIWVTNNTKWRKFVLEKLFEAWDLKPVAEWNWVKITPNGEPIFDIENIARKPYETLILAKIKRFDYPDTTKPPLANKIIFATPDIHSRKPCLKGLIEPYIECHGEPRCCEIFARNLTEGWLSWGDEVLKGNWRGCWE